MRCLNPVSFQESRKMADITGKSRILIILGVLGGIVMSACFLLSPPSARAQEDYLLGPEDVIEIVVWGHEDMYRLTPVSLKGIISYPLIGDVQAAGKSTKALESEIARKLGDGFIVNPQVNITVKQYKSQKVFLTGEVQKPGIYPLTKENSLLSILSEAGGVTKEAGSDVIIIRPKNPVLHEVTVEEARANQDAIIKLKLQSVLAGDPQHNVAVRNADSIIIARMPFFYILGEVKNPGQYPLESGTTVLTAITIGGGYTPKASTSRVEITREEAGKRVKVKAEMHTIVQPGDTIEVPVRYF
jgi:polysaccharide biosynthesis/export protein